MLYLALILLSLLPWVSCFTFMAEWKLPSFKQDTKPYEAKFGDKKICIITGTSSGLGKHTTKSLLASGEFHVIGAVRDLDKMAIVAEEEGFNMKNFTPMEIDLTSFESVRSFSKNVIDFLEGKPIDRLVCNAAVYQPTLPEPKYTVDDIECQMQTNYLSHFLLVSLLLPEVRKAKASRIITVGSVTGNDNTVGGGGVYPIADLRDLDGLKEGAKRPISMMDGYNFNGAKAYKDTKLALMMFSNMLHERYHRATGIAFSSIYPGCIAESPLFREKRPWFRKYFPVFMKYITGGYVSEPEAGTRLSQVVQDLRCTKSGVYWSWNGGPRQGRGDSLKTDGQIMGGGGSGGDSDSIYENDQSDKVKDVDKMTLLWQLSTKVTGAEWMPAKAPVSPCPTLKVIGFITNLLDRREKTLKEKQSPRAARSMSDFLNGGGRLA